MVGARRRLLDDDRAVLLRDGSARPYRMKIRAPSFVHMGAFDHMARGYLVADIITIFGTYDIVMGECDR